MGASLPLRLRFAIAELGNKLRKSMECTVAGNTVLRPVAVGFKPSWQLGNKLRKFMAQQRMEISMRFRQISYINEIINV